MKINTILSVFTPKDGKFFPLLDEAATTLDQAAFLLTELFSVSEDSDKRKELCKLIKEQETNGDKTTGKIFKELNATFITPFDREDISQLADHIDDATDAINRSAHKVLLYTPETLPTSTRQMTEIIKKGTAEVLLAVKGLTNLKKSDKSVRKHAEVIKSLEEQADGVYEKGIIELFKGDMRTIELIKLKEIIQELEKSVNKINSVGKVLKTIIVKYA